MIIKLKELSGVLSQISDLVGADKNIPGIMFRVRDDIEVCYSGGNGKVLSKHIGAEFSNEDMHIDMAFNYQMLTRIIEACKPTGKIVSDDIEFIFMDNNTVKVRCEKKIPIISQGDDGSECIDYQTMSVVEQLLSWSDPNSSLRTRALSSEPYEIMYHYSETEIPEILKKIYPNTDPSDYDKVVKPMSTEKWLDEADKWDVNELRTVLSKLSIESGKLVYMAPGSMHAFVQTTSSVICIPIQSEFKHRIVQSSTMAKAMSSVLSKLDSDVIYTHIINNDTVIYSNEENTFAISLKNMKQDNANITQVNNCLNKDFTHYMINFNREVLQSCLYSAKTAGASEKVEVSFQKLEDSGIKLVINAKNTNSSINNSYDIIADYAIDEDDSLTGLKLNLVLDVLYQAVSRAETDYIAFDINVSEDGSKMVRISEINLEKRMDISKVFDIEGPWSMEFTKEHRSEILGYTTYFAVSAN